jgi:Right handed beta helix region
MKNLFVILLLISTEIFAQSENFVVDALVNPKIPEQVLTVGGVNANIHGFTNEAIQLAVDALSECGGTVKLSSGQFEIKAPVRMSSNVKLIGSGAETVLHRIDGYHSRFIIDADFGELKLTVEDASGFDVGMSVQVTDAPNSGCWNVTTAVITDIVDNTLYIDSYLIRDYDSEQNGMVTNAGSCVSVMGGHNVYLSDFTIDGNKEKNDLLDGCNGGGVVIIKSKNVTVENIHIKNFNGEGITWQITEEVTVRNCEISGCANMGLHPGSGSPKSVIEDNNVHHNRVGLFLCWRVQHSYVRNNQFHHNSLHGISTGHKDSDVLFESNHVYKNGSSGIVFRNEDSKNSPHRNSFVKNTIEDNGTSSEGYGFYITGNATDLLIKGNIIRKTKNGKQKAAVYITKGSPPFKFEDNIISGHSMEDIVYEK